MPFKTRRQKEAAAQRRYTFGSLATANYKPHIASKVLEEGDKVRFSKSENLDVLQIDETAHINKELLRIMFAASFLIFAQIALRLTLA